MEHQGNDLFVDDLPKGQVEKCDGCGVTGHSHGPLRWKIENDLGLPPDVYCDACYWEFHKTDFAEEAVLAALKLARLTETFTLKELQRAMDTICGATPEAFARYLETGTATEITPRSDAEIIEAYGVVHGKAQATLGGEGKHAA